MPGWKLCLALVLVASTAGHAAAEQLTIGLFAPASAFPGSAARLAYAQKVAKAVEEATGLPTTAKAFVRYGDLTKADLDFAIIDGVCISARSPGPVLAIALVGGRASSLWGLYTRLDSTQGLESLKGKKLAYLQTGCRDNDFLANGLLSGEVELGFFGRKVGKPTLSGAVATVASYKDADVVFTPADQSLSLRQVFASIEVPRAGFVQLRGSLSAAVVDKARAAVLGLRSQGPGIESWRTDDGSHDRFARHLQPRVKAPVLTEPVSETLDTEAVVTMPTVAANPRSLRRHFVRP